MRTEDRCSAAPFLACHPRFGGKAKGKLEEEIGNSRPIPTASILSFNCRAPNGSLAGPDGSEILTSRSVA